MEKTVVSFKLVPPGFLLFVPTPFLNFHLSQIRLTIRKTVDKLNL